MRLHFFQHNKGRKEHLEHPIAIDSIRKKVTEDETSGYTKKSEQKTI